MNTDFLHIISYIFITDKNSSLRDFKYLFTDFNLVQELP